MHYFVVLGGKIMAEVVPEVGDAVAEPVGGRLLSQEELTSTVEGITALTAWRREDDSAWWRRKAIEGARPPKLTLVEDDD
jgi:hypothetical protein